MKLSVNAIQSFQICVFLLSVINSGNIMDVQTYEARTILLTT